MNAPPQEMKDLVDNRERHLVQVGPSLVGWIYESVHDDRLYRILLPSNMTMPRKAALRDVLHGAPGPTEVVDAKQDMASGYYVVEYRIPEGTRTLATLLDDTMVENRLSAVAATMRATASWWKSSEVPIVPMPADVLISPDGEAFLLPFPHAPSPGLQDLFAEPRRIGFVSGDYLRSLKTTEADGRELAIHALGVMLISCIFATLPPARPEDYLRRAAHGTWGSLVPRDDLPFWTRELSSMTEIRSLARAMMGHSPTQERITNLESAAKQVLTLSEQFKPQLAIRQASVRGPFEASRLLGDILLQTQTYELFVEAARLSQSMRLSLQAVGYFEQAIDFQPDRETAHHEQLRMIANARSGNDRALVEAYMGNVNVAANLDQKLYRSFVLLEPRVSKRVREELELMVARHYLWRAGTMPVYFEHAAQFIYPRIVVDGSPQLQKVGLNLAYVEALFGQGRYDHARQHLGSVTNAISDLERRRYLGASEASRLRKWGADLGRKLSARGAPS